MPNSFHLNFIGIPMLLDESGCVVRFRTRKHLAVLIYLAFEAQKRPVSREGLVDLFWPDVPHEKGRHSLSQALSAIRRRMGDDAIRSVAHGVRFSSSLTTDIEAGLAASSGSADTLDLFEGLETCAGPSWAHWVDGARARCIKDLNRRLQEEIEVARSNGNIQRVHERAELLYRVDPLSPVAVLALAERCLLRGETKQAKELLVKHTERAESTPHGEPDPTIQRLLARIGEHRTPVHVPLHDQTDARVEVTRKRTLVGRQSTLAQLEAAWEAAKQQGFCSILLTGPSGIGKSAILKTFATSVGARAWPTLMFTCQEMARDIPFAAISGLIHELSHHDGFSSTDPFWLAEASRLAPGLRTRFPGVPSFAPAPGETIRLRIAESLLHMIEAVSDGMPLLLAIDDLQHLDSPSKDVLHLLGRHLASRSVLFVTTLSKHPSTEPKDERADTPIPVEWTRIIQVGPLSNRHTRELIASRGDMLPAEVCEAIVDLSQGNPYLAEMLTSDWRYNGKQSLVSVEATNLEPASVWSPPQNIRNTFERKHRTLSVDALRTLDILAVARRVMTMDEIARFLAITSAAAHHITVELLEHGVVCNERGGLDFTSRLHRTFVYHVMPLETRRYHHKRLAETLLESMGKRDYQVAMEASGHFVLAGLMKEAVATACSGAEVAITHGAPRAAEAALKPLRGQLPDEPRIDLLLARSLNAEGRYRESLALLGDPGQEFATTMDAGWAALLRAQASQRGRLADDNSITTAAKHALEAAEAAGDEMLVVQALQTRAEVESELGNPDALPVLGRRAADISISTKSPHTKALAQLSQGYCYLMTGNAGSAIAMFESCTRLLEPLALEPELQRAVNGMGVALASRGDLRSGIAAFERAAKVAKKIGDTSAAAISCSNLGNTCADLGEFEKAEQWLRESLALEAAATNPRRAAQIHLNVANLRMTTGDLRTAVRHIDQAREHAKDSQLWQLNADVLMFEADLHIIRGSQGVAWVLMDEVERIAGKRAGFPYSIEKYERLGRHKAWTERGRKAIERRIRRARFNRSRIPLVKLIEIAAFDAWVVKQEGGGGAALQRVLANARGYGLRGVIVYLARLGIR